MKRLRLCAFAFALFASSPAIAGTPFYVSDSFTIQSVQNGVWHYPGTFNMEHTWGPNQAVEADFLGGEFGFILYQDGSALGVNGDVYIGLYDLSTTPPTPVPDSRLKYLTSTGLPMAEATLMNNVGRIGLVSSAGGRYVPKPIRLGGVTTPATGGPFQIGAHMRFFTGNVGVPLAYQYFIQGEVVGTTAPPSTSGSGGTLVFVDAGGLAGGQTKYTGAWAGSENEADVYTQIIASRSGTLRSLRVKSTAPGAGQSRIYTVRKNGVDTGLTVVLADTATVASDLVTAITVVGGDVLTLKGVASAGAAAGTVTASVNLE